ncbi:uncharacterized protein LOC125238542 [Leguminivora glycinivorella]|uniref:uncharacterized protein LOC125238542 n=1 Tax=Leguminivora glycinivorella TaxID=1035111 RepID=UPI00200FB0C6|nr:uncharacterized protein LOC125238542 [Leguminivora glycinivorella]
MSSWDEALTSETLRDKSTTAHYVVCVNDNTNNHPADSLKRPSGNLFKKVESKISDGDIKGAARLLFSDDAVAPANSDTLAALHAKHPPSDPNLDLPVPPQPDDPTLIASTEDVLGAILSFPNGSAGGLDGLSPQHLKDLLYCGCGDTKENLLRDLTALVNIMLAGQVPLEITNILYGANLCALTKKDGGIRPIAVGSTLRRLAAKIACRSILKDLAPELQPVQLGFGSKSGCEAAVHAVRTYIERQAGEVLLKVDISNAFNSVDRGALLTQIKDKIPSTYNFLWQCYSSPSKLFYQTDPLFSSVGCQQGDPLGPAIFSLAIHPILKNLNSKLNIWYLDDGTLGGEAISVLDDLVKLKTDLQLIGLSLNFSKCELFVTETCPSKDHILQQFEQVAPGIKIINKETLQLLGCPIMDQSFHRFIDKKIEIFKASSHRLANINIHSAYCIIKHCLFVPKFTYILRGSHFWKHPSLISNLDNLVLETLTTIFNISFSERSWTQASLPIRLGGLGIRKISSVALPAFLASVHGAQNLIRKILAPSIGVLEAAHCTEAKNVWQLTCPNTDLPVNPCSQKQWDGPLCRLTRDRLLETALDSADRARLLATAEWESGLWLHTLPSTTIGTLLDNTTFRLATCLRIGASANVPHRCQCGATVDSLGHHGLSCSRSAGRIPRHASLNDVIRRALASAKVPAVLEPNGLARVDGKRPDGMTLVPWSMGRPLVWDATCVDTLAPSHIPSTKVGAGAAASSAEDLKRRKYANLGSSYIFAAFGVETLGPWGPSARRLYEELSKRLIDASVG